MKKIFTICLLVLLIFILSFNTFAKEDKKAKKDIEYTNLLKNKSKIIGSDYNLLKRDFNKETKINSFITRD